MLKMRVDLLLFVQNNKMLLVSILGIAVVREYESLALPQGFSKITTVAIEDN